MKAFIHPFTYPDPLYIHVSIQTENTTSKCLPTRQSVRGCIKGDASNDECKLKTDFKTIVCYVTSMTHMHKHGCNLDRLALSVTEEGIDGENSAKECFMGSICDN